MYKEQILDLLKIDLGITHNKRDTYFIKLIETVVAELARKGIDINYSSIEDMMFVSDYSAWRISQKGKKIFRYQTI